MDVKKIFNILNRYYWSDIQERNNMEDIYGENNWLNSVIHFIDYGYERMGTPLIYSQAALKAIEINRTWLESRKTGENIEEKIYSDFKNICFTKNKDMGLNIKNNPMYPSSENSDSIINFAWKSTNGDSIAGWAKSEIEKDQIESAYKKLKNIRGIGPKIASFYLRDIFILSGRPNIKTDKYLLQPIDRWTKRASKVLGCNGKALKDYAQTLDSFEADYDLATGESNIGFWVLGSQICKSSDRFELAVKDIITNGKTSYLSEIIGEEIEDKQNWIDFLKDLNIKAKSS